jgi:hypothetical protein
MRIVRLLLVGALCVSSHAAAQVRGCIAAPHALPDDLRSSLEERLSKFLAAQAEEHWGDVSELLGRCRFGCNAGVFFYTSPYKQCLVSRMHEIRMLEFTFSIDNLSTCTTQFELPVRTVDRIAAEQLSWYVRGTGRFQTASEVWMEPTQVIAYRDQGRWYFTPPQEHMQEKWEQTHYTDKEFARDRREEIDIPNPPSSPIEITDVHVYMDRQSPSLRDIAFKLRNRTAKKVVGFTLRIGDDKGAVVMAGPYTIKAKGYLPLEESVAAYADFCEGIWRHAMVIEDVDFADGSKWEFKESGKEN